MDKPYAVGVLVQDRWNLTKLTLQSLLESSQDPNSYDLYLIDNGSNEFNQALLKSWAENHNCKNLLALRSPTTISAAWNLFLSLTTQYPYRTLMDNDIVLKGTGSAKYVENKELLARSASPEEPSVTNPGAPKNASIVRGPGSIYSLKRRTQTVVGSNFLDIANAYMQKYKISILSYIPVTPHYDFETMVKALAQDRFRGLPLLSGGCVTISKRCLDLLGYFDERLPRKGVLDYSQRAVKSRVNIGYHDDYWVAHDLLNEGKPHDADEDKRAAYKILEQDPPNKRYVRSVWTPIIEDIRKSAEKTQIVNLVSGSTKK